MIFHARIFSATLLCATGLLRPSPAVSQTTTPSRAASIVDSMPNAKRISQAAVSPDGSHVAYIVDGKLTVVTIESGSAQNIGVEGDLALRNVSWSADSKQVTFIADLAGNASSAKVWTAPIDGQAPTQRAELKGYVDGPSFSPDGSKLAVLFIEGMPRSAGPLQPMTPLAGVIGEKIYEQRLTTIDLATNSVAQVSPADMYVYEYDWTPDGQAWVATSAHGSGDANWYVARLYRVDARSGEIKEIYVPKLQIAEPRVSPDGKNVAFIEGLMSDEGSTGGDVFVVQIGRAHV